MPTAYTNLLGLALPVTGELQGTWGDTVNNFITNYLDASIAGTQTLSTDADVTLTKTTNAVLGATSSQYLILNCTGARAAARNITVPAQSKAYIVINATSGGFAVTLRGSGPTTGVSIAAGEFAVCAWNGTDFVKISSLGGPGTFTNLTVSGTTTLSGLTASTALALNASKEVVSVTNTGTGNNVLATSPTLTTPVLGAATATSINGLTISTTTGTLTLANGSTLATSGANSLTLTTTGATNVTFPTSGTLATTGGTVASFSAGTTGFTPNSATTGAVTLAGTLATTNGGTGLTSFTANGVVYASSTSALATGSALTFDGTDLTFQSAIKLLNNDGSGNKAVLSAFAYGSSGATGTLTLSSTYGNANQQRIRLGVGGASATSFEIDSSEQMRLTSTGLGIGTNNPQNKLVVSNGGALGLEFVPANGLLQVYNRSTSAYGNLRFDATQVLFNTGSSPSETMRLDSSGNLGIGTTNTANARFSVVSNGINGIELDTSTNIGYVTSYNRNTSAWVDLSLRGKDIIFAVSGSEGMRLTGTGLGIGTSSPGVKLHVAITSAGEVARFQGPNGNQSSVGFYVPAGIVGSLKWDNGTTLTGSPNSLAIDNGGGATAFQIGGTERMRLDSSGNLGIGTSSPSNKFVVSNAGAAGLEIAPTGTASNPTILSFNRSTSAYGQLTFSSDFLVFNTNGTTERMRLDTSGNLGLGVTPSNWGGAAGFFELPNGRSVSFQGINGVISTNAYYDTSWKYKTTNFAAKYDQDTGAHQWYTAPSGTAGNAISFTQAMTLDASGRLGVGTTTPQAQIAVGVGSTASANPTYGGNILVAPNMGSLNATGGIEFRASDFSSGYGHRISSPDLGAGNTPLVFERRTLSATWTESARITSGGDLLVGTDNSSAAAGQGVKFLPTGKVFSVITSTESDSYVLYNLTTSAYRFYVTNAGVINATNTTITAISDQRLKENIRDLDDGLGMIMALKPRKFDWKAGKGKDIKGDRGFIAQEFEQVFPDMISEWKDPAPEGEEPYKAVNANLIPTLVKAIQEQQALITDLRARVAQLERQA